MQFAFAAAHQGLSDAELITTFLGEVSRGSVSSVTAICDTQTLALKCSRVPIGEKVLSTLKGALLSSRSWESLAVLSK